MIMKNFILLLILPIFIGFSNVSADETGTGSNDTGTGTVNSSPVAVDDIAVTNEDFPVEIDLTSNDTDVDWDTLTVVWISNIMNGTWVINSAWTWVIFTPNLNFHWTWSFVYTVSDWELTDTWSVIITVNSLNVAPVAVNDTLVTKLNTPKTFDPTFNDTDWNWDILAISWTSTPSHWTVTFTSISVTYTPNTDYYGPDSFTYTIDDWRWWSDTWIVSVSVARVYSENNDNNNDNWNAFRERFVVQNVQKEYISKFNELKNQYKKLMWNKNSRNEYLILKSNLRTEYLLKLKSVTWQAKKYNYEWVSAKNTYKNTYNSRYWFKLSQMTDAQLTALIEKIDNLINEVNQSLTYSDSLKEKFNTMLLALRELAQEHMINNANILNIDSLFE